MDNYKTRSARGAGDPVRKGKHDFRKERWRLWLRRFAELSNEDWLEEESGIGARKVADVMLEIEQRVSSNLHVTYT